MSCGIIGHFIDAIWGSFEDFAGRGRFLGRQFGHACGGRWIRGFLIGGRRIGRQFPSLWGGLIVWPLISPRGSDFSCIVLCLYQRVKAISRAKVWDARISTDACAGHNNDLARFPERVRNRLKVFDALGRYVNGGHTAGAPARVLIDESGADRNR